LKITVFNPESEKISLTVYDMNGRKIETLANQTLIAGNHSFNWNNSSHKPGIYLINMTSVNQSVTEKIRVIHK
jgi:flagellar hook assembly protein FlgD